MLNMDEPVLSECEELVYDRQEETSFGISACVPLMETKAKKDVARVFLFVSHQLKDLRRELRFPGSWRSCHQQCVRAGVTQPRFVGSQ